MRARPRARPHAHVSGTDIYNLRPSAANSGGDRVNLADLFLSPAKIAEATPPAAPTAVRDSARVNMATEAVVLGWYLLDNFPPSSIVTEETLFD